LVSAGVFALFDDLAGQKLEEADVAQRTDHSEHAKKTGQCLKIEIFKIFAVWFDEKAEMTAAVTAISMTVFFLMNLKSFPVLKLGFRL